MYKLENKGENKMFCKNCGKEIDDKATVCIHCGVPTANAQQQQQPVVTGNKTNGIAIAGLVLSILWFTSLIGLILSIVGLQKSKTEEYNGSGRSVAIAGIVIGAILVAVLGIWFGTCGVACISACNEVQNNPDLYSAIAQIIV